METSSRSPGQQLELPSGTLWTGVAMCGAHGARAQRPVGLNSKHPQAMNEVHRLRRSKGNQPTSAPAVLGGLSRRPIIDVATPLETSLCSTLLIIAWY
jgi:hypothetical protein